ncbi:hypothetical protein KFK09_022061 [Dendrobium nobile]|uniref:Uncharacterized protein n=1 Tax=Dendrobium nobile TaxID=94219 RepID=A0A8T3AHY0_DENNO|nr:hypothetical protein KFK09_022061 [Dendrobium nobile]
MTVRSTSSALCRLTSSEMKPVFRFLDDDPIELVSRLARFDDEGEVPPPPPVLSLIDLDARSPADCASFAPPWRTILVISRRLIRAGLGRKIGNWIFWQRIWDGWEENRCGKSL